MVATCVNPACATPFRYLRGGRLFLVNLPADPGDLSRLGAMTNAAQFSEFFWLCEHCCLTMRIVVDKSGEAILLKGSERQAILRGKSAQRKLDVAPCANIA